MLLVILMEIMFGIVAVSGDCDTLPDIKHSGNNMSGIYVSREGDAAKFYCWSGYRPEGNATYICSGNEWIGGPFSCPIKNCLPLRSPVNGKIIGKSYEVGSVMRFKCDTGYDMIGSNTAQCQTNSMWQPPKIPECRIKTCPAAPSIAHGNVIVEQTVNGQNDVYGTVLKVQCSGYFIRNGPTRMYCTKNGQWTKEPKCESVSCPPYPGLDSGCVLKTELEADNTLLLLYCTEQSTVKGKGTASCYNNTWDDLSMECLCDCQVKANTDLVRIDNLNPNGLLKRGETLKWGCKNGATKTTTVKLTCSDGSKLTPICVPGVTSLPIAILTNMTHIESIAKITIEHGGVSAGIIVLIVIGVCVIIGIIAAFVIYIMCRKHRNSKPSGQPTDEETTPFPLDNAGILNNVNNSLKMAEQGTSRKINDASKSLSKDDTIREEMERVVGPNASWEDFLVPAPMCICLLGELMVISTTADFSLEKNPPKDGFKLMRWPNSFRASLTQVVNVGYDAFNEAHRDMDQIRLLSSNVSKLKGTIKFLLQGEDDKLEDLLPVPQLPIQDTAEKCLALATSVETKFNDVMSLTAEILEACVGAKGIYGQEESKEVEIALAIASENKVSAEEQKEMSNKASEDLKKKVDENEIKAPNQSALPPPSDVSKGAAQFFVRNEIEKIERSSAQAQLGNDRNRYNRSCDKWHERTKKLGELSKLDIQNLDFDPIRQTLIKGIKELGSVREEWTKLVMFFIMMSNISLCSLDTSSKNFGTYAAKTKERQLDMINKQAFEVANIAHLVNSISGIYVEVSRRYIMDTVAGLGKLQGYDPKTERKQILRELQKLHDGCRKAQEGIRALVKNKSY